MVLSWPTTVPTGRDYAVETLLDQDPDGDHYRTAKLLDEVLPKLLENRPDLITKSALVEQAYALEKYCIDTVEKYDAAFSSPKSSATLSSTPEDPKRREHILSYHRRIISKKAPKERPKKLSESSVKSSSFEDVSYSGCPRSVVSALRRDFGETSSEDEEFIASIENHEIFQNVSATDFQTKMESVLGNLSAMDQEKKETILESVIIATLTLLIGNEKSVHEPADTNPKAVARVAQTTSIEVEEDPSTALFQVGPLLSLFPVCTNSAGSENGFESESDVTLLEYFGQAAAIYEERVEVHKANLLSNLPSSEQCGDEINATNATSPEGENEQEADRNPGDHRNETETQGQEDERVTESGDEENEESSESNSDDDSDIPYDEVLSQGANEDDEDDVANDEDDSSSSDSSSNDAPIGSGRGLDTDEEDVIMRLAETLRAEMAEEPLEVLNLVEVDEDPAETPATEHEEVVEELPLPSYPEPPTKSFSSFLNHWKFAFPEGFENLKSRYLDPSVLSHFGAVPIPSIVLHFLEYVNLLVACVGRDWSHLSCEASSCVERFGAGLLENPKELDDTDRSYIALSESAQMRLVQLTAHLLTKSIERRSDAIESFAKAVTRERLASQGSEQHGDHPSESAAPDEEDDPALNVAMHHIEDDSPLSYESLAKKGMRRKAAAAAHDAKALLLSLQKKSRLCREEIRHASRCVLLSLNILTNILRSLARDAVAYGHSTSRCTAPFDVLRKRLPRSLLDKLLKEISNLFLDSQSVQHESTDSDGEDTFFSFRLYRQALFCWVECIPLFYASSESKIILLQSLLDTCVGDGTILTSVERLEKADALSPADSNLCSHQLILCSRRFRVRDILSELVPELCLYRGEVQDVINENSIETTSDGPYLASSVVSSLLRALKDLRSDHNEVWSLCLALCHRYNSQILLFGSLETKVRSHFFQTAGEGTPKPMSQPMFVKSNPSSDFQFDSSKCSDSIAMLSDAGEPSRFGNGSSVLQRASKVWGTVLSSQSFSPGTGVHRWAIRLDKCERGHIFVGVATSQASLRTYVGGDRYGWGMIGTQALWHDRKKIRGDYGATVRTGSVIIVTLDTDAGTLSYSLWRGDSPSSISSGLRTPGGSMNVVSDIIDDWGVAFEGLPLDAKLFPAVGLYQRDDRVTILPVESSKSPVDGTGCLEGELLFPRIVDQEDGKPLRAIEVQHFNNTLCWDGLRYARETLCSSISSMADGQLTIHTVDVLNSLAATVCLIPSGVPMLSSRFSLVLLPELRASVLKLCKSKLSWNGESTRPVTGKWLLRAKPSTCTEHNYEEYTIELHSNGDTNAFSGFGIGTSSNSKNGSFTISGLVVGSSVRFLEEWNDSTEVACGGKCCSIVNARLTLNGRKFEGSYLDVHSGKEGSIAAERLPSSSPGQSWILSEGHAVGLLNTSRLLCLAHSHLRVSIYEDTPADCEVAVYSSIHRLDSENQAALRSRLRAGNLLARVSDSETADNALRLLSEFYGPPITLYEEASVPGELFLDVLQETSSSRRENFSDGRVCDAELLPHVERIDTRVLLLAGGKGPSNLICPIEYGTARRKIICAMIFHSNMSKLVIELAAQIEGTDEVILDEKLIMIWKSALAVVENGIRASILASSSTSRYERGVSRCNLFSETADFLINLRVMSDAMPLDEVLTDVIQFFDVIENQADLDLVKKEMKIATMRAMLRVASIRESIFLLSGLDSGKNGAFESVLVGVANTLSRPGYRELEEKTNKVIFGANLLVRQQLEETFCRVFHRVISMLADRCEEFNDASGAAISDSDSFLLISLVVFALFLSSDIPNLDVDHRVIAILSRTLDSYRQVTAENRSPDNLDIVQAIAFASRRDRARAIVRSILCAYHFIIHRTQRMNNYVSWEHRDLIVKEISYLIPFVEGECSNHLVEYVERHAREEWHRFCCSTTQQDQKDADEPEPLIVSGPAVIFNFGLSLAENARANTSHQVFSRLSFAIESITWLLDILCMMSRPAYVAELGKDERFAEALLRGIGVSQSSGTWVVVARERGALRLPAVTRIRLARLLTPILATSHLVTESLVGVLFELVGLSSPVITKSLDKAEANFSSQLVSLLRQLHSPIYSSWRKCINDVAGDPHVLKNDTSLFCKRVGLLSFFAGSSGAVCIGSYIMVKPPSAGLVSMEYQTSPGAKAHSGSIGGSAVSQPSHGAVPHHVVGNGTESIVAGLCRGESSAGIVTDLDLKNGNCEVVLVERNTAKKSFSHTDDMKGALGSNTRNLTIRAIRVPLKDAGVSQEVPLFLGDDIPSATIISSVLDKALKSMQAAMYLKSDTVDADNAESHMDEGLLPKNDAASTLQTPCKVPCAGTTIETDAVLFQRELGKSDKALPERPCIAGDLRSGIASLAGNAIALRCCIVLLSDPSVSTDLRKKNGLDSALSSALAVAWPDNADAFTVGDYLSDLLERSVSFLPLHESRFVYLVGMLQNLNSRKEICARFPEELWAKHFETLTKQAEEAQSKVAVDSNMVTDIGGESSGEGTVLLSPAVRDPDNHSTRSISQSTGGSNSEDDDEEESDAAATAAEHLREAAIAQMAELGLPRSWSELALRRTGGTNIEAAVTFCLERAGDMERLVAEDRDRENQPGTGAQRSRSRQSGSSDLLMNQLMEMGFPSRWCTEALAVTGNVDEALTWILSNGERLSAEDEARVASSVDIGSADGDESAEDDETEDDDEPPADATEAEAQLDQDELHDVTGWTGPTNPLRFISGRASIDSRTLRICGLPTGGFSSVGTKGVLLSSGKWYYEAILETAGCLQIGWADCSFSGHCNADRGDGCGDGPSSWAFDGWRRYRWHATATEWGCRWKEGDVVGCLVDMDCKMVSFTLNGQAENIGMGLAFSGEGFRPFGGVYACVSFNRREKLRMILGGPHSESFRFGPPQGYRGVGEAVDEAIEELDHIVRKESVLDGFPRASVGRLMCDLSGGEHGHELMSWSHRYYGSDASVHLGSPRALRSPSAKAPIANSPTEEDFLSRRVAKFWLSSTKTTGEQVDSLDGLKFRFHAGYEEAEKLLAFEAFNESVAVGILLVRKLILHVIVTGGPLFNPNCILGNDNTLENSRRLWHVLETCTNLKDAGWVGEAGAMAIAAESLGLGISSVDQAYPRPSNDRFGVVTCDDIDEGLVLPVPGVTQLLSTVFQPSGSLLKFNRTDILFCANAEYAICGHGGGGLLSFLADGLKSALMISTEFRSIVFAAIRRGVRVLSAIEYDGADSEVMSVEDEVKKETSLASLEATALDQRYHPDPRLIAILSGCLLSMKTREFKKHVCTELGEAWSVGLLSHALPWRMVSAYTFAGILNECPSILPNVLAFSTTVTAFLRRLPSTTSRRLWAERAAAPVSSRYSQALVELLSAVTRAMSIAPPAALPYSFLSHWNDISVDAATPLPLWPSLQSVSSIDMHWEARDGWVSSDDGWEILTGYVTFEPVQWRTPTRSSVRSLMDGGDGPPMLREGCLVMRGVDWGEARSGARNPNEDGKDIYEMAKEKREIEKRATQTSGESKEQLSTGDCEAQEEEHEEFSGNDMQVNHCDPVQGEASPPLNRDEHVDTGDIARTGKAESHHTKKKKKKINVPQLPVGTVISIEAWDGIPGQARRVRWHLTGIEGIYRYGGDGGKFDVCHIETNEKMTKIVKRHPLPESSEQCASRHGFGAKKSVAVLLRLHTSERVGVDGVTFRDGFMEWSDFSAGARVECYQDGEDNFTLVEKELIFGAKDSGWEVRFGQPSYIAGTRTTLSKIGNDSSKLLDSCYLAYDDFVGSTSFTVPMLRNSEDGKEIVLLSQINLRRGCKFLLTRGADRPIKFSLPPAPVLFDRDFHAPSLTISEDGRTVCCASSEGRATAFASVGFTKGVHYWEVKLEQADVGSVFIGVAEKPCGSGAGSSFVHDAPVRLNRWHGWGFVNFRATYTSGAERVYGSHCHSGDTVGVLLDCDAGRISFFYDGLKYGEHIMNDLGCAFENLSPFGFNAVGCGSGGAGQGAPSAFEGGRGSRYPSQGNVRPRTLWPVVGLRNQLDRVTISNKWTSSGGIDGVACMRNLLAFDEILPNGTDIRLENIPSWFMNEACAEYRKWKSSYSTQSVSRGSGPFYMATIGQEIEFNTEPIHCAAASAVIGLNRALLAGDRVRLKRSAGRILELEEEALVLGTYQGRIFYRIVTQKSEGGSLVEGGGRCWCLDESEVVDGLTYVSAAKGLDVPLPAWNRFRCSAKGGLRVIYKEGAVLRSDLEIFDHSSNLGTIPVGTVIPRIDVLERRVNSCGLVRFRIKHEALGEGWISAKIRGGKEEEIVEQVFDIEETETIDACSDTESCATPVECAEVWFRSWEEKIRIEEQNTGSNRFASYDISGVEDFKLALGEIVSPDLPETDSNMLIAGLFSFVCELQGVEELECTFGQVLSFLSTSTASMTVGAFHNTAFSKVLSFLKTPHAMKALLARIALLRAFNRRARWALPWVGLRPCQEGSGILGGMMGHGTSVDRVGRSRHVSHAHTWINVESIAARIRLARGLLFSGVKMAFLKSVVNVTTTPTPLSHDEYELPREIRTVRVNRLKASRVMASDDMVLKRKYSVFSQLQAETRHFSGAALRRGYIAKGHGGQKRAFKVKLIGEGVNDYSGPYREIFTDAVSETQAWDNNGLGVLGVLDPTPNRLIDVGENRDLMMFSLNGTLLSYGDNDVCWIEAEQQLRLSFATLLTSPSDASREAEESLFFLGRLLGTGYRHGISLDLPLPNDSVWRMLTEEKVPAWRQLYEIDSLRAQQLGDRVDHLHPLLVWQQRMVNSFAEGLGNIIPVELLPIFSGPELQTVLCGRSIIDVDLLLRVVEYEGYDGKEDVIKYFWETLRTFSNDERKMFLQFVWARNRLPLRVCDFETPFKIQKDSSKAGKEADAALPSASTCFFSLTLPEYSNQTILRSKLLFAISNVTTMETDFQTNTAEIAEGYRAL